MHVVANQCMLLGLFFYFGLSDYLSFASLNRHHTQLQLWTMTHFTQAVLAFILCPLY